MAGQPDSRRSPMFVGSLVAAIAATVALIFLYMVQVESPPPPAPPPAGQGGGHPPALLSPPSLTSAVAIVAALFAIAWISTILAAVRDHILRESGRILSDYGEMRETEGYLNGFKQGSRPEADVRQLHPVPKID